MKNMKTMLKNMKTMLIGLALPGLLIGMINAANASNDLIFCNYTSSKMAGVKFIPALSPLYMHVTATTKDGYVYDNTKNQGYFITAIQPAGGTQDCTKSFQTGFNPPLNSTLTWKVTLLPRGGLLDSVDCDVTALPISAAAIGSGQGYVLHVSITDNTVSGTQSLIKSCVAASQNVP